MLAAPDSSHSAQDVLIRSCSSLLRGDWTVQINKIYREANFAADVVANRALSQRLGLHHLPYPPEPLRDILKADSEAVGVPRSVSSFCY